MTGKSTCVCGTDREARSGLESRACTAQGKTPASRTKVRFPALRRLKGKGGEVCPFPEKGWHHECDSSLICRADKGFFVCGRAETRPAGRRSGIVPGRRNRKPDGRKDTMRIRKEEPKDREAVYRLVREAFASAEHADGLVYPAAFGI